MQGHKNATADVTGADGRAEIRVTMEIDGRRLVYAAGDLDSISFAPVDQ